MATMKRVRFLILGGFLGAGKTTAIARLARRYIDRGLKVAIVTNDQAYGLVDTQSLEAQGLNVGEVTGACFCCKFDDLVATAARLSADEQPDVILAEPVGSCTDLAATVAEPLAQLYGDRYDVGPLGVLLKPEHGRKILGGSDDVGFSPKAAYIFLKQLEEADVIAINKIDKLSSVQRQDLLRLVGQRFPGKKVLAISARRGDALDALEQALSAPAAKRTRTPEVDYDIYAEGEAELGWLNCTVRLTAGDKRKPFSLDEVVLELVVRLREACAMDDAEPAHLKVFGTAEGESSLANLVSSDVGAELSLASEAKVAEAELTVNARVAIDPARLSELVQREAKALATKHGLSVEMANVQSFRPGRPVPTHRMAVGQ
jgi:G3E family GTPase